MSPFWQSLGTPALVSPGDTFTFPFHSEYPKRLCSHVIYRVRKYVFTHSFIKMLNKIGCRHLTAHFLMSFKAITRYTRRRQPILVQAKTNKNCWLLFDFQAVFSSICLIISFKKHISFSKLLLSCHLLAANDHNTHFCMLT